MEQLIKDMGDSLEKIIVEIMNRKDLPEARLRQMRLEVELMQKKLSDLKNDRTMQVQREIDLMRKNLSDLKMEAAAKA